MLILTKKQQEVINTFDQGIDSVRQERDKKDPRNKAFHVLNAKLWEMKYQRLQCINQWLMGNDIKVQFPPSSKPTKLIARILQWLTKTSK